MARQPVEAPAGTLIIRADADQRIGVGHIMRCFALMQAWHRAGGQGVIVSHCESELVRRQFAETGASFVPLAAPHPDAADLATMLDQARRHAADWIVLDGYGFDPAYQRALRGAGSRVLIIDDVAHWASYHANALLNQNLRAIGSAYAGEPGELMLGTQFALLRAEFLPWRRRPREIPVEARHVLVTLGGADPHNVTATVVDALQEIGPPDLEIVVVVGASNTRAEALAARIQRRRTDGPSFRVVDHTAVGMPELMAWADVAISGAGSTCWELAFMGLPALLIVLADNQQETAHALSADGYGVCLGASSTLQASRIATATMRLLSDRATRANMAARGPDLVDGLGADRVVQRLLALRRRQA